MAEGTWSPDIDIIVAQFENDPLPSTTITYTPPPAPAGGAGADAGAEGGGAAEELTVTSYIVVPVDEFPPQVLLHGGSSSATVSAPHLRGFFEGKITLKLKKWDDSEAELKAWEALESNLGAYKAIFAYFPPNPGTVVKYFEVTAQVSDGTSATRRYGVEVRFNHTPGRDKLLEVQGKLKARGMK